MSQGLFAEGTTYFAGGSPINLLAGDFNGDARPDLIAVNYAGWSISFLAGNGNGTFASHPEQALGSYVIAASAADFDADGKLDLAVVRYDENGAVSVPGRGKHGRGSNKPHSPHGGF